MTKIFKFIIFLAILILGAIFIYPNFRRSFENSPNLDLKVSTSTINLPTFSPSGRSREAGQNSSTTSEDIAKTIKPFQKSSNLIPPIAKSKILEPAPVKEVSSKSFEELINSSVIQLYCGYFNNEAATFSNISRGTGVIIDEKGEILTNRHIIYDENSKKVRNDCFVLKSPFPNEKSQNSKIYYITETVNYPAVEKFSDSFSKDRYYNDFAILKISSKPNSESKINLLLGFDYASAADYPVLEDNDKFNYLPIDWNYQPKDGDTLITLGYGVDASHIANKITSTIGKLSGNIDINGNLKPQILLIESNATAGFSGGALINPQSKGLIGLISWITSGDEAGKYTVAIFRDFLKTLMLQDLNFDLK